MIWLWILQFTIALYLIVHLFHKSSKIKWATVGMSILPSLLFIFSYYFQWPKLVSVSWALALIEIVTFSVWISVIEYRKNKSINK